MKLIKNNEVIAEIYASQEPQELKSISLKIVEAENYLKKQKELIKQKQKELKDYEKELKSIENEVLEQAKYLYKEEKVNCKDINNEIKFDENGEVLTKIINNLGKNLFIYRKHKDKTMIDYEKIKYEINPELFDITLNKQKAQEAFKNGVKLPNKRAIGTTTMSLQKASLKKELSIGEKYE